MRALRDGDLYFFIDEAGDSTFYNRKGKLIVGTNGCSSHLLLGFVRLYDPGREREKIVALREEVLQKPEFQRFRSIARTDTTFHAAKDAPPVRDLFFELIQSLSFRAVLVVAQKDERFFRKRCDSNTDKYYDGLVSDLLQNSLHRYTNNHICIAARGSRKRQEPLEAAVRLARERYEARLEEPRETVINVTVQTPTGEPCLTIIDYVAWAIQRAYVTGDMTYYNLVKDKVALIREVSGGKRKTKYFCSRRPFEVKKS